MKKTFGITVMAIFVGIALVFGIVHIKSKEVKIDKASSISKDKLENSKATNSEDYTDVELYFGVSEDSADVVKEERLINNEELLGEIIMQELIKGPAVVSKGKAILPKETRLINFSINEGVAYINLSSEVKYNMSKVQEETLLKSISTSMEQLVSVEKIMITVNNEGVETLGGNYNISKPFSESEIPSLAIQK